MSVQSILHFTLSGWVVLVSSLFVTAWADAQNATRSDFVSDASWVLGTYTPQQPDHQPVAIVQSAENFLGSLNNTQRAQCVGELKSHLRREWTNLPAQPDADGIRLGDLNMVQVKMACDLMANLFSEQGYNKIVAIMLADDQLLRGGRARPGFGAENFSIVIFGTPSESQPWGFQLDGHHVGVNVSLEGDRMTMSPSFIGTQPQAFKIAGKEYRPFAGETDLAHQLALSLTDEQVRQAVQGPRRVQIVTGPGNDGRVPQLPGVPCGSFDDEQKTLLLSLIRQWVDDLPEAQASKRMSQISAEVDQMRFGWNGDRAPGSDVSYTLQSPSLIIEYACQSLGGDPLNHLHSVYRDPTNEYGGQLE